MREVDALSLLLNELFRPLRAAMLDLDRLHSRVRRIVKKARMLELVRAELAGERARLPPFKRRTISKALDSLEAISGATLVRDFDSSLAVLSAPGAFDFVLQNLVRHMRHCASAVSIAVRAYPLALGAEPWPAESSVSLQEAAVVLEVTASGIGIYERLESSLLTLASSDNLRGARPSVGPRLSQLIARAHGGDLWLANSLHGAALVSLWPMAPAKPRHIIPAASPEDCWPQDSDDFAKTVRAVREAAFLTREDFAIEASIAASTLRNVETLRHRCTKATRSKIIETFARLGIAPSPAA